VPSARPQAKGLLYGASALFHLVPWRTRRGERTAMTVDVALVPLGIFGGIVPFSAAGALGAPIGAAAAFWRDVALGGGVLGLNVALVAWQMPRSARAPPGDATARSLVCLLYYIYNQVHSRLVASCKVYLERARARACHSRPTRGVDGALSRRSRVARLPLRPSLAGRPFRGGAAAKRGGRSLSRTAPGPRRARDRLQLGAVAADAAAVLLGLPLRGRRRLVREGAMTV